MYTARTAQEKKEQNRFFFWYKLENRPWIRHTLERMGRSDLIERLLVDKREHQHAKKKR
jgi:hypothetical protein